MPLFMAEQLVCVHYVGLLCELRTYLLLCLHGCMTICFYAFMDNIITYHYYVLMLCYQIYHICIYHGFHVFWFFHGSN